MPKLRIIGVPIGSLGQVLVYGHSLQGVGHKIWGERSLLLGWTVILEGHSVISY